MIQRIVPCLCLLPAALAQCDPEKKLSSAPFAQEFFGFSVALSGQRAVVGTEPYPINGSAHVFERGPGGWTETAVLRASDSSERDVFGRSVAISGDTIVVSAQWNDDADPSDLYCESGSVYVYEHRGAQWLERKLLASDHECGDVFGYSIDVDAGRVVVGAPQRGENRGAVYVFERTPLGWFESTILTASDAEENDQLGHSVAVDGNIVVAGSIVDPHPGGNRGSVYVFEHVGGSWLQTAKLRVVGRSFGAAVDVDEDADRIAATRLLGEPLDPGAVHVFERSGNGWQETAELIPTGTQDEDGVGISVAVDGDRIITGALGFDITPCQSAPTHCNQGAVFLFDRVGSTWVEREPLAAFDAEPMDVFGNSVALEGGTMLVGAHLEDDGANMAGAAYFYGEPPFTRHCASTPNSTGGAAMLSAGGCGSVVANDLVLTAHPVPNEFGFFAYGRAPAQVPFGNGNLCLAGTIHRLAITQAASGALVHAVDLSAPPTPAATIVPGSLWSFQGFFRDPAAGGFAFDSSDALAIIFAP